jgi:hypothetical protein
MSGRKSPRKAAISMSDAHLLASGSVSIQPPQAAKLSHRMMRTPSAWHALRRQNCDVVNTSASSTHWSRQRFVQHTPLISRCASLSTPAETLILLKHPACKFFD